jgi:orotate phosphoribosyltransferase
MFIRTQEEWIDEYRKRGALWIHDRNPKRPHALLTSGNHSSGFFNSKPIIDDEALLGECALDLVERFQQLGKIHQVECVVGPQTGATKLARLLSEEFMRKINNKHTVSSASPEKGEGPNGKIMTLSGAEKKKVNYRSVLLCEDVLTTGESVGLTASAVSNADGNVMPFVLALVNRSGKIDLAQKRIVTLISRPMPIWAPSDCPLCKQGSIALRPKTEDNDNWIRLNAQY